MANLDPVLRLGAERALDFASSIDERNATPTHDAIAGLVAFEEELPAEPTSAESTIELLARIGGPATMGSAGSSYFGFVNGATLPVALATSFIVNAWDQNAALPAMSPVSAKLHDVCRRWLVDLFGLAHGTDVVHVTGATVANATCLAAARDALLAARGWDAPTNGLFGAPPIQVVVGEQAHSTLRKSLGFIGLGSERIISVPCDDQGRIRSEALPDLDPANGPILFCAQAGEVNTGSFDPFGAIADWVEARDGWLHVDGAFGLWALADPTRTHLVDGLTRADSLATDAHKWLNVTYDSGIALVQRAEALRRTFASVAGYLPPDDGFEAMHHTPQSSQRPRQIEIWAVLRTLGASGVAELVQRACAAAMTMADRLAENPEFQILNDVVLNQVLVRYRDAATTAALVEAIQRDGRIWCGSTQWRGATAMRISVSSWKTETTHALDAAEIIRECARSLY